MEELILKIFTVVALECPVILCFIWFVVTTRKADHAQMEFFKNTMNRQMELFQIALDKVLDKIGDRLDRIEDDLKIVKAKLQ